MKKKISNTILVALLIFGIGVNVPMGIKVFTNCPIVEEPEAAINLDECTEVAFNPVIEVAVSESQNSPMIEKNEIDVVEESMMTCEDFDEVEEVEEVEELTVNTTEKHSIDSYIKKEYIAYCEEIADKYENISPELLVAMIEKETGGKNQEVKRGKTRYQGLTMINPKYQKARMKKLGIKSLMDEYSNILCCADILQTNYDKYGSIRLAVIGFNAGEYSKMFKTAKKKGTTTKYCKWVMNRAKELK